ncbi:MAG TPA: acetyl-coenzyme A synthetase, partial [Gammaproteobacteria bacterium]|nr:acetyl-coenzyme A synthetase [Gammaproteobacteria bacterium]
MADERVVAVKPHIAATTHMDDETYRAMYAESINSPETFWAKQAEKYVTWFKGWERVSHADFGSGDIRWFEGGKLNASYNCLDRHLESKGDDTAIIWEGDEPGDERLISYRELHSQVSRFGNLLKSRGVNKGDRVAIYMPMIPEAAVA